MSVTPDFIGQVYKDTNTGNIWRANSLTAGDWTLEVQDTEMFWTPKNLTANIRINSWNGVTTIAFPALTTQNKVAIEFAPQLQSLDYGALVSCTGNLDINVNAALTAIDVSSLQTVTGYFQCISNALLVSVNLSPLQSVGDYMDFQDCSSLTTITISGLTSLVAGFRAAGCALSGATVNAILARLVSMPTYGNSGQDVDLSGGTSAAPSGQGLVDKATLIGRGAFVTTN